VGILKEGERVRIVDCEKKSNEIYVIKKIESSKDNIAVFLLKSDSSNDHIIFYESKTSHLEKI
jgi:hypothetical protein